MTYLPPRSVVRALTMLVIGAAMLTLTVLPTRPVAAQRAPITPTAGLWCGPTADGGHIYMQLTPDSRFVDWVDITTPRGMVSTRENPVRGITSAQIADAKFMFRQRNDERFCTRDRDHDPRGPRERCQTITVEDTTVHGTFTDVARAHGSYSSQQIIDPRAIDENGRGNVRKQILVGTFDAWPVSAAPCP
jgi:hypothetical protein